MTAPPGPPKRGTDSEPVASLVKDLDVYDEAAEKFGTIADTTISPNLVHLRPLGGGVEWTAKPGDLRPALASELLALRLPKAPQ